MNLQAIVYAKEVSKIYRIYSKPSDRLKEALIRKPLHHSVFSLRDVSFSISHGDTLGIIGENGAGKTTLLKILAGTIQPSSGKVEIKGRIAALLELGAGFHPEFTGRQNIKLNGLLLGLSKGEIQKKEEEIIQFADIGGFIDRPIKTYSSGMVIRLAFSIATTVDPDILIIDEALSVGDQRFQQKCIDRMVKFKEQGKVLVVCSHSMFMINELCTQALWLHKGKMRSLGQTGAVVSEYLSFAEGMNGETESSEQNSTTNLPDIIIEDISLFDDQKMPLKRLKQFDDILIQIKTRQIGSPMHGHLGVALEHTSGQLIFGTTTKLSGLKPVDLRGKQVHEIKIASIPVVGGSYRIKALIGDEYSLRLVHEKTSPPIGAESDRPELGMLNLNHWWVVDAQEKTESSHS